MVTKYSLMLAPSGPQPVGTTEKILLVDGVQQIQHHLLHQLILQGRNRDWPLFPILFSTSTFGFCAKLAEELS